MFLSYLVLFYTPVNQIHSVNHLLQHALAASERVFEVLDANPAVPDQGMLIPQEQRFLGKVEWKDIAFSYRPEAPVFTKLSMLVDPGARYVGGQPDRSRSHAGKLHFCNVRPENTAPIWARLRVGYTAPC